MYSLTMKTQNAISEAQNLARESKHIEILSEHLFYSIFTDPEGLPYQIAQKLAIGVEQIRNEILQELNKIPAVEGDVVYAERPSRDFNQLIQLASSEANGMNDEYVSLEHILLAYLNGSFMAKKRVEQIGLTRRDVEKSISELRGAQRVEDDNPEGKFNALEKYGQNLNELAMQGKLDPVIGRDEEIRRTIQILSRRTKNNPLLIGEPGVGKTAIVEGLADKIVNKDVPETIQNKTIVNLDMGSLIAGTKYRGEFEDRIKAVLKEVISSEQEIVLFVDEIHTIVGAGSVEGAMDAANLLKPALAKGQLKLIGATTLQEYQKHIEKDAAMERRFQLVYIKEPDIEDTITILRGIKEKYEIHHGIRITDQAIHSAVHLSEKYISDRFLPDKAIDLIDESCSKIRIELGSLPSEMESISSKIRSLEIEKASLKTDKSKESVARSEVLEKKLSDLKENFQKMKIKLDEEKKEIEKVNQIKKEIDLLKVEEANEERTGNLNRLAEIRYGLMPILQKKMHLAEEKLKEKEKNSRLLKEEVSQEDVADVVSKWTGIPVSKMLQSEKEKLLKMEEILKKRVVGQDDALNAVAQAIRRNRAGLSSENKPIGSFIFLGPTGVGKTETARSLAEFLFDNEKTLLRIDMSEYMEKHSVARLIGSPPGYIGHDEGGQLTEAVRRRPYSVILFDEVEKAHPDVFNIFLQILDDGLLTDSKGRHVNFKNTLIIMTSNLASQHIAENLPAEKRNKLILESLRSFFKPEFLNRIDETIIFEPIQKEQLSKILDIQLAKILHKAAGKGVRFVVDPKVKQTLVDMGYDPVYGARPLLRVIQDKLMNPLSKKILEGDYKEDSVFRAVLSGSEVDFKVGS